MSEQQRVDKGTARLAMRCPHCNEMVTVGEHVTFLTYTKETRLGVAGYTAGRTYTYHDACAAVALNLNGNIR